MLGCWGSETNGPVLTQPQKRAMSGGLVHKVTFMRPLLADLPRRDSAGMALGEKTETTTVPVRAQTGTFVFNQRL